MRVDIDQNIGTNDRAWKSMSMHENVARGNMANISVFVTVVHFPLLVDALENISLMFLDSVSTFTFLACFPDFALFLSLPFP